MSFAQQVTSLTSVMFRQVHAIHMKRQEDPTSRQERCLRSFRPLLSETASSKAVGFDRIAGYREYVREIPPTTWSDYTPYVERVDAGEPHVLFNDAPRCMALTSGTTGYLNKPVPYNDAMLDAFRAYQLLVAASMATACPQVNPILDYRVGYAAAQVRAPKRSSGLRRTYTSTVLTSSAPSVAPRRFLPRDDVLAIADWNEKLDALCAQVQAKDVRIVTGMPLYMASIFEHIVKRLGLRDLSEIWPDLAVFFYSGSAIEPFRRKLESLAGHPLTFLGGYIATEGPLGFPVDETGLMAFNIDRFLFSFLPLTPGGETPLCIDDVLSGVEYELLLGMPNGFLQYRTGDLVRIQRRQGAVLFRFAGRREATINLVNEKVSQPQLDAVFQRVCAQVGITGEHYFVHPGSVDMAGENAAPRYVWTVVCGEAEGMPGGGEKGEKLRVDLAARLDEELRRENPNYRDVRIDDTLIAAPEVRLCAPQLCRDAFDRGRDRGQFKLKSVLRSEDELRRILGLEIDT